MILENQRPQPLYREQYSKLKVNGNFILTKQQYEENTYLSSLLRFPAQEINLNPREKTNIYV